MKYRKNHTLQDVLKVMIIFLNLLFFAGHAKAQSEGDYQTNGDVDFTSPANWEVFNSGSWVAASNAPDATDGVITIQNGHKATITASINLDQLVVASGGTLAINSGQTLTLDDAAGTDLDVTGTVNNQGAIIQGSSTIQFQSGSIYTHNVDGGTIPTATWDANSLCNITGLTATTPTGLNQNFGNFDYNSAFILVLSSDLTVAGNLMISSGTIDANAQTLNITGNLTGTGNLSFSSGTLNITGDFSNTGTYTPGTGTVNYTGSGQTLKVTTYNHLTLSGGPTTFGGISTINGNFTLSGTATATTSANLSIGGNLNIGDGTTLTIGGNTLSIGGATTIGGGTSGTIEFSSSTNPNKTFTGLVTLNAGALWNETTVITPTFSNGITNNGGTFTSNTGVHTFATNAQALNGTLSIPNITVTAIALTNNGVLTVGTALSGTGALTNAFTGTLNIGGTSGITTLTASAAGNTVNYTSTTVAQTIRSIPYHHLSISKTGQTGTLGGNITVNGNLTINGGTLASDLYQITGNASGLMTMAAGTTLQLGRTNNITNVLFPTNFINTNILLDPASTVVYQSNGAQTVSNIPTYGNLTLAQANTKTATGSVNVTGNLTVNNNVTLNLGSAAATWNITGNATLDGTLDFGTTIAKTLNLSGDLINVTGTLTMTGAGLAHQLNLGGAANTITTFTTTAASGSTVNYNRNGDQQVFPSVNYQNLNISTGGVKSFNANANVTINNNLTVNDATLAAWPSSARTYSVSGDLSGNGTIDMSSQAHALNLGGANNTIGTLTTAANASTVTYNRSGDQQVIASPNYRNLTISGSGIKTLQGDASIGGNLNVSVASTTLNLGTIGSVINVAGTANLTGGLNFGTVTNKTLTVNNNFTFTATGTLDMSGNTNHRLNLRGATNSYSAGGTFTPGAAAQLVAYDGDTAQGVMNLTYRDLYISNYNNASVTARAKSANGAITVNGDLTIDGVAGSITTFTIGNISFNANGQTIVGDRGAFLDNNNGGVNIFAGLLTLNGSGAFTSTAVTTVGNLVFRNGITHNGSGNFSAGAATLNTNAQNIQLNSTGNISFGAGNGAIAVNSNLNLTGNGTGSLTYNGTGTITIAVGITLTNQRTFISNGRIDGANGTSVFTNAANSVLFYANATQPMNTGTFTVNANPNTVNYSLGGAQTVRNATYHNLIVSSSGLKTLNNTITVNNNLEILGTATLYTNTFQITGNATGSLIMDEGTTLQLGRTNNAANVLFPTNFIKANILLNSTSTVIYQNNNTQTVSTVPDYGNLTLATGNIKTFDNLNNTINILGNLAVNSATMAVNSGLIQTINVNGNLSGNGTINLTGGALAHVLNLGGATNAIGTLTSAPGTLINYNRAGDQTVFGSANYHNLTISGSGTKTMQAAVTLGASGVLTLSGANLALGNFNLTLNNTAVNAIQGTFSNSSMIVTNGTGYLVKNAASLQNLVPIGSNNFYNPVTISSINPTTGTISLRAVTGYPGATFINKYWDIRTATSNKTISATFQYNAAEVAGDSAIYTVWYSPTTTTNWQTPPATGTYSWGNGLININNNTSLTTGNGTLFSIGAPTNWYSYQTGNWSDPNTWTTDPGGTTLINPGGLTPQNSDKVTILTGRTVTLTGNVTSTSLDITLNNGAFLDMSTFTFAALTALRGQGTLKLASANFPTVGTNTFVLAGGGTVEYTNAGSINLPNQLIYNNLTINSTGTVVQNAIASSLTLNGNLHVKQGTFQINDGTAGRRVLIINGNVNVDLGASITTGTGQTNNPADLTGGTAPLMDYYVNQSHRIEVYGNFTNNGTVRFTNQTNPDFNTNPTDGYATVFFRGATNNNLTCNGVTDFYNIVVNKGADPTYKLNLYSDAYNHFRIFGANDLAIDGAASANPNIRKALWIYSGTMTLSGLTVIPTLTEGTAANSEFIIPNNAALQIDGPDAAVFVSADDYREINAAWGTTLADNTTPGISVGTANEKGLQILGKLTVNDGYVSAKETPGIVNTSILAAGNLIINGGIVDVKQINASGLLSYTQTNGTLILRGRMQRTPSAFTNVDDLLNAPLNTTRADNGITTTTGSFTTTNTNNAFSISGGTIRIYDVTGITAPTYAFQSTNSGSNCNVTGGTLEILPTAGTVSADASNFGILSNANFGNLLINRGAGCTSNVQLAGALTSLGYLKIQNGTLDANNQNLIIKGDLTIENGTSYIPGTNTTTFNGTTRQVITVKTAAPLSFSTLTINKTATDTLTFSGSQGTYNVTNLNLYTAILTDSGKTINVSGNIYSSGRHRGTGKIVLSGDGNHTIDGDGNGIFQNLELNKPTDGSAIATLSNKITVNGILTLSGSAAGYKSLNLATYNLSLGNSALVMGATANRYIYTSGNVGDGGITKTFSASADSFLFPIGVSGKYTPAAIAIGAVPTTWGSITLNPADLEHPNTTPKLQSLSYYFKVRSSGFTGIQPGSVSHFYKYNNADVAGTETNYIPARFDYINSTWTTGAAIDVDETADSLYGSFFTNINDIEGDYTAGDAAFGATIKYYSMASGRWDLIEWSNTSHSGPAIAGIPPANAHVEIGGNDSVYLNYNQTTPNLYTISLSSLKIETGSALDIGYNPGCNLGIVLSNTLGNGNFRLTTSRTDGSTYVFPSGDFTDFNVNLGTTDLYSTNPNAGTTYWLPQGVASYGNLILAPLGGSNIIFPNNDLTIYGNCNIRGQNADSWFCPAWSSNYPTPPTARIAKTITIKGNMNILGGAFVWYGHGALNQHVIVEGDVYVAPNAGLYTWNNASSSMAIGGDLINNTNNSTAPYGSPSRVDFRLNGGVCGVTFFGSTNARITNTLSTPTTNFYTITVNKGNTQASTLTIDVTGTFSTTANNWLTLQNGTLIYNRDADLAINSNSSLTIPATAGLTINAPGRTVSITNGNNNGYDLFLSGKLKVQNGTVNVGATNGANNNDIEYSSSGASEIEVTGGTLFVNGQIRRNPSNSAGVLRYKQTGGTVTINGVAQVTTNAKLEVVNSGSVFNMAPNAVLNIVRGGGGTTFGDLYLRPDTSNITGGKINFVPGTSGNQSYRLDATVSLDTVLINGSSGNAATVQLLVNPLTVNGDFTINNTFSTFTTNNINTTFNGNFINNGTYNAGSNTTTFSASTSAPYLGNQSLTGAITLHNLVVNPGTQLTLNNDITVKNDLTISNGIFALGNNKVNLKRNIINNGTYTNLAAGFGLLMNGTAQQEISGTGTFGKLEINNYFGARLNNDLTLEDSLKLTQGILDINSKLLTLGINSKIGGAPFNVNKMIRTDGVFSDIGIKKFFDTNPTIFEYPIGVTGKYTPATLTISQNTLVGSVRVNCVDAVHPSTLKPDSTLQYYWDVESSGIKDLIGNLKINYNQADVRGTEKDYIAARLLVPLPNWSETYAVDTINNVDTFYYNAPGVAEINGEYTTGVSGGFPPIIPTFTSNQNGNWNDPAIWTQTDGTPFVLTGAPNGFKVIIEDTVTLNTNNCQSYQTTINGKLKVVTPFFGHNLGLVDGVGTLYLESGNFPAGVYTDFLTCLNNSTLEYGGTGTYTIIADLYNSLPNVHFSGTGTRVLPNKDLTICNSMVMDGPMVDNSVYNKKITINGTIERYNTSIFNSGTGTGATVSFGGSLAQTVGGATGNFTGSSAFNNLEVNNSSGLSIGNAGQVEVKGNLLLTNGIINTSSTNTLTITNTATDCVSPFAGSASSYINGPLIKRINQGDQFVYPVGKGIYLGNKLKLTATQTGTQLWKAEYFSPNPTYINFTSPIIAVAWNEYWKISAPAGNKAIVNLSWNGASDISPLVTDNGLNNMRIAWYNNGTGRWNEIASTASGANDTGTIATNSRITISAGGSDDYTFASTSNVDAKAKFTPSGAICGNTTIPVTFSAPESVPTPYTIIYSYNGVKDTITGIVTNPYLLPTTGPGTYQLVNFKYDNGASTGVVDNTVVTAYDNPTTAGAMTDQYLCGQTFTNLNATTPTVGTGVWSIVSGVGGTVITPTSPTSQFNGTFGNTYTLKWTISNGACKSSSNVLIGYTTTPLAPTATSPQTLCDGAMLSNVSVTVPGGSALRWFDAASGGSQLPSNTTIVTGTTYYAESYAALCSSPTRKAITVNLNPLPAAPTASNQEFCAGATVSSLLSNPPVNCTTRWYTVSSGGSPLASGANLANGNYYAESYNTVTTCISSARTSIVVTIIAAPAAPNANDQSFCGLNSPLVDSLVSTPPASHITRWYNVAVGGSQLAGNTALGTAVYHAESYNSITGCVSSSRRAINVTVYPGIPAIPGVITGNTSVCPNISGQIYSITAVPNTVTYHWAVPSGWSITAGQGTISVTTTTGADTDDGNITVNATNNCGTSANATLGITINPYPTVDVGSAIAAICQGGTTVALGGSFGGGAASAIWSDGGAGGIFTNNDGTTPNTTTYTAAPASTTPVTLTLTTTGGSCGTTSANKSLTVNPNPTVNVGAAVAAICQGGTTVALGGSFGGGAASAIWSDGGAGGTFTNNDGTTPNTTTYTAAAASTTPVTLTLTTAGGSCGTTSANKSLTVNPNPATGPMYRLPNN